MLKTAPIGPQERTSGVSGVLLDGLTLLDESVLGRGQTALHGGAHDRTAQSAGDGSLGEHFFGWLWFSIERRFFFLGGEESGWCDVESDEVSLRAEHSKLA